MSRLPTFVSALIVFLFACTSCTPRETELIARTAHTAACAFCEATGDGVAAEDAAAVYSKALREVTEAIGKLAAAVDPEEVAALRAELSASQERERLLFARMVALAKKAKAPAAAEPPSGTASASSQAVPSSALPAAAAPVAAPAPGTP